jgi:hypothetical protein
MVLEKQPAACLHQDQWELALVTALVVDFAVGLVVGSADQVVLVGIHKEGKDQEESLVQAEDTNLVERHKAYQGIRDQEDHLDPNCLAEEDRMEDTQGDDQKEDQEVEDHAAVAAAAGIAAVVVLQGPEQLEEQTEVGLDAEEPVLVVVLPVEDEIRSILKIDQ